MRKSNVLINAFVGATLICSSVMLAQEPVVDIDRKVHPNLAEAQRLVVEANGFILKAQQANNDDMKGHAQKARDLLVEVNRELKRAAEVANEAGGRKR